MKRDDDEKNDGLISAFVASMLKNLPDLIFIKNTDLVYISVSHSFAKMMGMEKTEELVGKTDAQLFKDPELVRRYTDDDRRLLKSGKPLENYIEPSVSEGKKGYYRTSKFPLFDDAGRIVGLFAISHDVTLEYKAKLNYDQELHALFELPPDALAAALFDVTNWRLIDKKIINNSYYPKDDCESMDGFLAASINSVEEGEEALRFFRLFSQDGLQGMFESGKRHLIIEYRCRLTTEILHWVRVDLYFLLDPVNGNLCLTWILKDMEEQKQAEWAIAHAAEWDSLTNVYNREATMTHMQRFLSDEGAAGTHWLFMIDVDNFKLVNDTFGHRTGDETLVNVAGVIKNVFRETDIVGRVGGDEFFVLMKDVPDYRIASLRAKSLVEALQYVCAENQLRVDLSGSVGVSCYAGNGKTLEKLYTEADSALYKAKKAGKNCVAFAEQEPENIQGGLQEIQEPISAIHLRTLLENMDATMFQTELAEDGDVQIAYSSHSLFFREQEKTSCQDTLGESIWSAIFPEDLESLQAVIREATVKGTTVDHICRIYNSEGKIEWRHIRGTQLPASGDNIRRMIHVATDITLQKQIESELREKDSIIDFAMRNTDVNLWYFDYEKAECQLTKSCQKAHEMPGIEILSDFPESLFKMDYVREDCIERLRTNYARLRETGESTEFDAWYRKSDGSGWWCERDMISPVRSADGKVVRGIGIGKNVTAEKEMEEKFHTFQSYRSMAEKNTLTSVRMNLSTGWCGDYVSSGLQEAEQQTDTVDGFLSAVLKSIPTKEEQDAFPPLSQEYLLEAYISGETSLSLEYRSQQGDLSPVWLRAVVDMIKNPTTGDVEALYYTFDIDYEKNMGFMVDQLLIDDYEFMGLLDVVTGRLMVFGDNDNNPDAARNGGLYEQEMQRVFGGLILEEYYEEGIRTMSCAHVMEELETKEFYTCSFPAKDFAHTQKGRKQWKFSYLDDSKSKIMMSRTDITNIYTAERDPLTGLYNRETFYRQTKAVLNANPDRPFIVIRFDIDRFKAYNDVYGTQAGDRLLADLGRNARESLWPELAVFGRLEADHFVFLIPQDDFDVDAWHERQNQFFENEILGYRLTSSVGIYEVTDRDMDISLMCDRALLALKTVKDNYNNKMAWYDKSMRDRLMLEQTMADEMEQALRDEQFVVYFQPLVNYDGGRIIGAEALVRWIHPKQGVIPPIDFIPLFEKNGFILKLDAYVWEKSCEYLRCWLDEEGILSPVPISVNISRCDLYDPELCEKLQALVAKYRLPFSLLKLEITESAYMEDPDQLIGVVNKLRAVGFTVEMDDFGSGYSSLNMLKDVPVDILKLDTKFIVESENNARATIILSAIIHMAQELSLSVIAEGVETKAQADYLKDLNCVYMQGYYFGRPMPAEAFVQMITIASEK